VRKVAEALLEHMIQKINEITQSLDGTIAQINQMRGSIDQMSQNFSEQTVALTENVRLIVEVLKQFRVQSSKSIQDLSDDFNNKIKGLWEKKSIEAIKEEEKKAIETIKKVSKAVGDNLYYTQLLSIIQSIREETNRLIGSKRI
jgi:TolA-binding protein